MKRASKMARVRANGFAAVFAVLAFGGTSVCAHEAPSVDNTEREIVESDTMLFSLNLLSAPRPGKRTVRTRSMGNGSYLCSLAGLGQRSRCRRN